MNERQIFIDALEKETPDERRAYLDLACGGDSQLRSRMDLLLRSHAEGGSLLDHPVLGDHPTEGFFGDADRLQPEPPVDSAIDLGFLEPGTAPEQLGRLGHYEILEVVGRGGMGIVLKARDARLHRVVAVKVLAPELAVNPTARRRFLREAQAAAAVSHDHVVTIHAVEENESARGDDQASRCNPPYLVMEFVDGQSLQEKIAAAGQLELKEILRIGRQIAAGLAAAHAQGLIHRDVKPSNILLQNGIERVKVTDFGLARAADDVSFTRTGEIAGTPQYMSPEQAQGQPVDARSDLFSLGSVLYAMCTGRSPFRATSTVAVLRRVCDDVPRPIREVNPDIPDWLAAIVDRLLAKNPAERFQTAAEVAELLGRHLAHVQDPGAAPLPSALSPVAPRGRGEGDEGRRVHPAPLAGKGSRVRGHRRWAVAAALLLALAAGLGVTEATGVTQLSATVVRIVTGEGTLVIEVDDPAVQVSLDGEELSITGAGLQEVRLRPGQYQFQATVNGEPVRQELVTISRGDRQVVRVTREGAAEQSLSPAAAERGAFVVLGGENVSERKFDTLAEAVLGASDGDTIEVRGNGPFVTEPVDAKSGALTIQAADGFRPIVRLSRQGAQTRTPLLKTDSALVLEGIEFQRLGQSSDLGEGSEPVVIWGGGALLHVANCRFFWTRARSRYAFLPQYRTPSSTFAIANSSFVARPRAA